LAIVFGGIIIILIGYIVYLQFQLRSIANQLKKRLVEKTRQPISVELINNELNELVANINKTLKSEENFRLNDIKKENQFKEMIANISHDLRTPLTAIKGYQQLLLKEELSEEQIKKLEIAQKHADELGILIEKFFEYSYILNSDIKPEYEKVNLTQLVTECIVEYIEVFEEKNLRVDFLESSQVFVLGDRNMLARITRNLIGNCIAHSKGNVEVKVESHKDMGVISFKNLVENTSEIDEGRIFERFYTGDKSRGKSTGLGLSIVKLLTEQLGGTVYALLENKTLEIMVNIPKKGL
jgi:signal transduction histidine kinase